MNLTDFARSAPFLLAVSFPFSRSARYPRAVALARQALQYREIFVRGRLVHLCAYAADRAGAAGALGLLEQMGTCRGWRIATETGFCQIGRAREVLACYLAAPAVRALADYCPTTCPVTDPSGRDGVIVLPCKQIKREFLRTRHFAGPTLLQLKGAAATAGATICPQWKAFWREQQTHPHPVP